MKKIVFAAAFVAVGILFFANGAGATEIKEGQWTMTMVIHMDDMDDDTAEAMKEMENMSPEEKAMMERMMGGMKMGGREGGGMGMSTTITQCITNDNPVPEANKKENCKQTHSTNGNTVNFEEVCPTSHSTGQMTYANNTMNGTIHSTQTENGKEETVIIDISGEYVGPCDPSNTTLNVNHPSLKSLTEKELSIREKELDLKSRELEIKQKEIELQAAASNGNNNSNSPSSINNVKNAVSTTNSVRNTIGGLRSLLGR